MPMRIAVLGASSGIGRQLVHQARMAGHHVVAAARSIGSEPAPNLTPISGSILDPGVAERVVAGCDAVAWCVKDRQEALVKASGLDWTIVRPTLLTNGPRTGQYRVLTSFEGLHGGRISRADCADCLLHVMVEGTWSRTAIVITE